MKKLFTCFSSILLVVCIFIPMTGIKEPTVNDLLRPYQAVLDRINRDLGSTIQIPPGSEEKVYNNIKELSLPEFEKIMREEYLDSLKYKDPPKDAEESSLLIPLGGKDPIVAKKSSAGGIADRSGKKSKDGKINPVDPIPNARGKIEAAPLG